MKSGIYNLLTARFLVHEDANRNWWFIVYLIFLAILMIANAHRFEQKVFHIADLEDQSKELRSEFVDKRSELMKIKMESTISKQMALRKILPSAVPPQKIKVDQEKQLSWWEKLWK
jgi:hypothetical protein